MKEIRIGIVSDSHGNLPALQTTLKYFQKIGCKEVFHLGDAVSLGSASPECVRLLLQQNVQCVLGNHEWTYLYGVEHCQKKLLPDEVVHEKFIREQMGEEYEAAIRKWPFVRYRTWFGKRFAFTHYAFRGKRFFPITHRPTEENLNEMFSNLRASVIFYGHEHVPWDVFGKRTYIDVGSVGCNGESNAKSIVLTVSQEGWSMERISLPYEKAAFLRQMKERGIPSQEFICENYFGKNIPDPKKTR